MMVAVKLPWSQRTFALLFLTVLAPSKADTPWQEIEAQWYRGRKKKIRYVTTTCLWSPVGGEAIPIRLVVIKDPAGQFESAALMSTDVMLSALVIIEETDFMERTVFCTGR